MYLLVTLLFGNVFISTHANADYYKDSHASTENDGDTMSLVRNFLAKHRRGCRRTRISTRGCKKVYLGFRFQTSNLGIENEGQSPYLIPSSHVSTTAGPIHQMLSPESINQMNIPYSMNYDDSSSIAVGTRNLGGKRAINGSKTETNKRSSLSSKPETLVITVMNSTRLGEQGSKNLENKTINNPTDTVNSTGKQLKTNVFDINDVKKMLDGYKIQARSGVDLSDSGKPSIKAMLDKIKSKHNLTSGQQKMKLKDVIITDEQTESPKKFENKLKKESNLTSTTGGQKTPEKIMVIKDAQVKLPNKLEVVTTGKPNIVLSAEKTNIVPRIFRNTSVTIPVTPKKPASSPKIKTTASGIQTSNQFSPRSSGRFAADFPLTGHLPSSSSNNFRENLVTPTNNFLSSYFDQDQSRNVLTASPAFSRARNQPSSFSSNFRDNSPTWRPSTDNFPSRSVLQAKPNGQQNGCNVEGRFLLVGDKWSEPGVCGLFTCEPNSFRTVTTGCPSLTYQEGSGCIIKDQDMSLDFPRCCPILSCPINEKEIGSPNNIEFKNRLQF